MNAEYLDMRVHFDYQADVDAFAKGARRDGVATAVSAVGPMFCHESNGAVEAAMRKYPDTIIGMGYVALGTGRYAGNGGRPASSRLQGSQGDRADP